MPLISRVGRVMEDKASNLFMKACQILELLPCRKSDSDQPFKCQILRLFSFFFGQCITKFSFHWFWMCSTALLSLTSLSFLSRSLLLLLSFLLHSLSPCPSYFSLSFYIPLSLLPLSYFSIPCTLSVSPIRSPPVTYFSPSLSLIQSPSLLIS